MGPSGRHRTPTVGTRVVLRYRRELGAVPSQSDALGILEALTPQVRVRTADGAEVAVDPGRVVVLKSVPPRPVRTSSIRALETVLARARPAAHREWVAGWMATAGDAMPDVAVDALAVHGATPLADPSMPEGDYFHDLLGSPTLAALHEWYSRRGLPLVLRLPDRMVRPPSAWETSGEHTVLAAALPLAGDGDAGTAAATEPAAVEAGAHPARARAVGAVAGGGLPVEVTARLADSPDDATWAVLTLTEPGGGDGDSPYDVSVPEAVRRLCRWAAGAGASHAVLAVPEATRTTPAFDEPSVRALGFADHHRCRFVRLRTVDP